MQLIDGPTLAAATLTLREKVAVLRQVAEAVQAAHELGIVHRDLKPANIMLERVTDGWHPYVMDFGLAREVDKTLTSGVAGTPQYMAPEQARGDTDAIGPRTDVWALGATLYTLLAGKPPFDGEWMMEILRRVEADEAPRLPSLPRELEAIVLRCLEKVPAERYASAAALARDLAAFERGDPVSARPPGFSRHILRRARRHVALLSVALAAVVLGGALLVALRRPAQKWRASVRELEPAYEENASHPNISPDGKWLLFDSDRGGQWQLHVQSVEGGPSRLLRGAGQGRWPSWSSDGSAVYFFRATAPVRHRAHAARREQRAGPVGPVGRRRLAGGVRRPAVLSPARRRRARSLAPTREPDGRDRELTHADAAVDAEPACTRNGSRVVLVEGLQPAHVVWLDVADGVEHVLPALDGAPKHPVFRPDGRGLVLALQLAGRSTIWEQALDGRPARQLTDGGHEYSPRLTPDGRRLFFNEENRTSMITARPLDGSPARHLGSASGDAWNELKPTRDGREIIVSRQGSKKEIVAVSVADGSERVLAPGGAPALAPDDEHIYFRVGGHNDTIGVVARAGGAVRTVARLPGQIVGLVASADALHVALYADDGIHAWRQPYDGSAGAREGTPDVGLVEPGADGWSLETPAAADSAIIVPPKSSKSPPVEVRLGGGRLTADGRAVVAIDDSTAWIVQLATGEKRRLLSVLSAVEVALSPDGNTLYSIDQEQHTRRAELTNYAELPPL